MLGLEDEQNNPKHGKGKEVWVANGIQERHRRS